MVESGDASLFLEACAENEFEVLGVEGFEKDGSSLRPDMEMILDLSALDDSRESIPEESGSCEARR